MFDLGTIRKGFSLRIGLGMGFLCLILFLKISTWGIFCHSDDLRHRVANDDQRPGLDINSWGAARGFNVFWSSESTEVVPQSWMLEGKRVAWCCMPNHMSKTSKMSTMLTTGNRIQQAQLASTSRFLAYLFRSCDSAPFHSDVLARSCKCIPNIQLGNFWLRMNLWPARKRFRSGDG